MGNLNVPSSDGEIVRPKLGLTVCPHERTSSSASTASDVLISNDSDSNLLAKSRDVFSVIYSNSLLVCFDGCLHISYCILTPAMHICKFLLLDV